MPNLYAVFRALIPADPLLVAQVVSTDGSTSTVQLPGGSVLTVRGSQPVGTAVFVRSGVIESEAPALPTYTAEI